MMMTIGKLAKRVGVTTDCVRFYERVGLLAPGGKTHAGYRLYPDESATRLAFIKHAQRCGFSLPQIRELLQADAGADAHAAYELAVEKKREIEETTSALQAMSQALSSYIETHERTVRGDAPAKRSGALVSALGAAVGAAMLLGSASAFSEEAILPSGKPARPADATANLPSDSGAHATLPTGAVTGAGRPDGMTDQPDVGAPGGLEERARRQALEEAQGSTSDAVRESEVRIETLGGR